MDIKLPNGKVIRGVPEGTPKEQIKAKAIAAGLASESDFSPAPPIVNDEQKNNEGFADKALGVAENVASFAGGAISEPIAGISGLVAEALPGGMSGAEMVENVRSGAQDLFSPRTDTGKRYQQNVGEALQPLGEALSGAEKYLGDKTLEATGSPFLASIAHTLPTAVLEIVGIKGSKFARKPKRATDKQARKAIEKAAPSAEDLKSYATQIYKEIDDSGATIK